eukprot:TRINITY_DN1530_c0_g1_i3.p1 TRINITY_DN1530_c0_g1~~TRINITY_DN1530_c0_g1_i3.p1  ORF type:complete len:205 (-),score=56.41 TRINITY_DN1530_c0_g1_i3:294-908(-)
MNQNITTKLSIPVIGPKSVLDSPQKKHLSPFGNFWGRVGTKKQSHRKTRQFVTNEKITFAEAEIEDRRLEIDEFDYSQVSTSGLHNATSKQDGIGRSLLDNRDAPNTVNRDDEPEPQDGRSVVVEEENKKQNIIDHTVDVKDSDATTEGDDEENGVRSDATTEEGSDSIVNPPSPVISPYSLSQSKLSSDSENTEDPGDDDEVT